MKELTILLVEDDSTTCTNFSNYIDTKEDISLVNVTNNASQAISDISYYRPDVVILDLELHKGVGNGLEVLFGLSATDVKPYIIVTTNNSSNTTYEYARHLGADFILYKHQNDYSEQKVIDFLISIKNIILETHTQPEWNRNNSPESHSKKITKKIFDELDNVGIRRGAIGYKYLVDAIYMVLEADKRIYKLCNEIAKKHNKSEPSVERAMQSAINKAWTSTDINILLKYYTATVSTEKGSPTITEFVYYYADKIKNTF